MSRAPLNGSDEGEVIVDPVCSKPALEYLKRRFFVEKQVGIEQTGELRFIIRARIRRTVAGKRVTVKPQKAVQYELALT